MKRSGLIMAGLLLGLCGCYKAPSERSGSEEKKDAYSVKGEIRRLEPDGKTVLIKHEDIPGLMPAMTMPFTAANTNELRGLAPGDQVSFELRMADDHSWIQDLKKLNSGEGGATNEVDLETGSFRLAPEVEDLQVGMPVPSYTLTNHLGEAFQLTALKGNAVAMTFIYARCPLPDFCPRMNMNFKMAHEMLSKDSEAPDNWRLLSVSFDPGHDTPAILNEFHENLGGSDRWIFATGPLDQLDPLTESLGLYFSREQGALDWNHNLRTVIIGEDGVVKEILIGNSWTPEELVEGLKTAVSSGEGKRARAESGVNAEP